jgi:quinol monooxygenase YgiN
MAKLALYGRLVPKPGKEAELEAFLKKGAVMAQDEPATVNWFALREDTGAFGIFDTFDDEAGRDAHLTGHIAKALFAVADDLLAEPPHISKITLIAEK